MFSFKLVLAQERTNSFFITTAIDTSQVSKKDQQVLLSYLPQYHNSKNRDSIRLDGLKKVVDSISNMAAKKEYNRILAEQTDVFLRKGQALDLNYFKVVSKLNSASFFFKEKAYKKAVTTLESANQLQGFIQNKEIKAEVLYSLGKAHQGLQQSQEALMYFAEAIEVYIQVNAIEKAGAKSYALGVYLTHLGDHSEALKWLFKALPLREQLKDSLGLSPVHNRIANIYKKQKEYTTALEFYEKSLVLRRKIGKINEVAVTLNNIGVLYKEQHEYLKALEYYQESLAIKRKHNSLKSIAATLNNIGTIHNYLEQYKEALAYYHESLTTSKKAKNKKWQAVALFNLADVYLKMGLVANARRKAEESYLLIKEVGQLELTNDALKVLKEVYKVEQQWEKALAVHEEYTLLKDSLFNERSEKEVVRLKANYEVAQKEHEIKFLSSQNEVLKKNKSSKPLN